ncbi:MAG: hypothetical protein ABII12_04405 [Planctomycetota bacterium]
MTEQLWKKVKSAAVVITLTVFIWLVADQGVREEKSFPISVRLNSDTSERYASFAEPPYQIAMHVLFEGRRRQLRAFEDLLKSKALLDANVNETQLPGSEPRSVSTERDVLYQVKEVRQAGLVVKSVSPETALVLIDTYQSVPNVVVEPDYGDLRVVAEVSPKRLSVRLPRFAARRLEVDPAFRPDVEQRIREVCRADNTFEISVPVTFECDGLDPEKPAQITPASEITISGRIESLSETRRKGPIQITWSIPDEVQSRYTIVPRSGQSFRCDIELRGPRGQVEQLPLDTIRGFVDVMAADEPNKEITRSVQFVLPEGFSMASDPSLHEIMFTLVPRAPAGG